jgi:transcription-repair coupling factor (superfamily II helicase)
VVCPLQSVLQKVPSPAFLEPLCRTLTKGDTVVFEELPLWLSKIGYRRSSVVADKGEFAVRGGIIDLYPVGSPDPYRIEFFGDEIDNIRTFDPVGQKSTSKVSSCFISPAYEDALLKKDAEPCSLFSYLGKNTVVIFDNLLALEDHYVSFQALPGATSKFFQTFDSLLNEIQDLQKVYWTQESMEELSEVKVGKKVGRDYYTGKNPLQPLSFEFFHRHLETKRWHHPFVPVQGYLPTLERSPHLDIYFICASESEEKSIQEKIKIQKCHFERGYLSSGFALSDSNVILIPMTEFTHKHKVRREKWRNTYHTPPSDFHELVPGDLVVHFNHGIGKYLGIEKRPNHQGLETEFLALEYNDRSKLYVPVSQAYLVSRYIGTSE